MSLANTGDPSREIRLAATDVRDKYAEFVPPLAITNLFSFTSRVYLPLSVSHYADTAVGHGVFSGRSSSALSPSPLI